MPAFVSSISHQSSSDASQALQWFFLVFLFCCNYNPGVPCHFLNIRLVHCTISVYLPASLALIYIPYLHLSAFPCRRWVTECFSPVCKISPASLPRWLAFFFIGTGDLVKPFPWVVPSHCDQTAWSPASLIWSYTMLQPHLRFKICHKTRALLVSVQSCHEGPRIIPPGHIT